MMKILVAYAATLFVIIALDMLWLGVLAKEIYAAAIGHLLAPRPGLIAAALFYTLFSLGLVLFAVVPNAGSCGWSKSLTSAALFGFFTYMTYDLTNLATLRGWPVGHSVLDVAWGVLVSVCAAACGTMALRWFARQ